MYPNSEANKNMKCIPILRQNCKAQEHVKNNIFLFLLFQLCLAKSVKIGKIGLDMGEDQEHLNS